MTTQIKPGYCPRCGALLNGRHCLTDECGYTQGHSQEERIRLGELKLLRKPEPEHGVGLMAMCAKHNLTLPANAIEWRAKNYIIGKHQPLFERVFLIATDGVVAWFTLGDRETLFFGQLKAFVPDEKEANCGTRSGTNGSAKAPRPPSKAQLRAIALAEED